MCTMNKRSKGMSKGVKSELYPVYRASQYRDQRGMSKVSTVVFVAAYRVMLLMSEVLKVHTGSLNTE